MNLSIRISVVFYLVFFQSISAQNCLDTILNNPVYRDNQTIINGPRWHSEKLYLGSPMIAENTWPRAEIRYNGISYRGITMNYDLYKDELIVFSPKPGNEKYLILSKNKLEGFSYNDSLKNRNLEYEYIELPGTRGKALYERESAGQITFFIRPMIQVISGRSGNGEATYSKHYAYFLKIRDRFEDIHTKRQFLTVFSQHRAELKKYFRRQHIRINDRHPENMINLIRFYNTLIEAGYTPSGSVKN